MSERERAWELGDATPEAVLSRPAVSETTVTELTQPIAMSQPAISGRLRVVKASVVLLFGCG